MRKSPQLLPMSRLQRRKQLPRKRRSEKPPSIKPTDGASYRKRCLQQYKPFGSMAVYLDYNATTPIHPVVLEKMLPFLKEHFGNPSSSHTFGIKPKEAVALARQQVCDCIGASKLAPDEYHLIFTSGGTESINLAFHSVLDLSPASSSRNIIVSAVEHVAVLDSAEYLASQHAGIQVSTAPVDSRGIIDLERFQELLNEETVFVSVMLANNETGSIQPVQKIVDICKRFNPDIVVHSDASQCIGKIPVDVTLLDVDMLTIAGHKIYSPKGIGAHFVRHRKLSNGQQITVKKLLHGAASQEFNLRAGTENVPYIVGLGESCKLVSEHLKDWMTESAKKRDLLLNLIRDGLRQKYPSDWEFRYHINSPIFEGAPHEDRKADDLASLCLPNTLNIAFRDQTATSLLQAVRDEVAASPGAACHSDTVKISHVLAAMDIPMEFAKGSVRLSVGIFTTEAEITKAAETLLRFL
eukprot:TRINITY_DN2011_c0_g1_i2.p1 TRINITY_DN2011_c0_g1~~TRINITY_DN2011_c0_g1_i2.p1  ORF type:complete len:467 (-),score=90.18 TRINITY_DN2011_c0_g1_i2:698-2098(-)